MKTFILICILLLGVAGGATADVTSSSASEPSVEKANPVPAPVLLRISPEIRQLTIVASLSSHQGATWSYPVVAGPAFVDLLTNFVRSRFGRITTDAAERSRAAVTFELVELQPEIIEAGSMINISIEVTMRLTVSDGAGRSVFRMIETGHGQRVASNFAAGGLGRGSAYVIDIELANRSAIENMLQKFGTAINDNEQLRKVLVAPR